MWLEISTNLLKNVNELWSNKHNLKGGKNFMKRRNGILIIATIFIFSNTLPASAANANSTKYQKSYEESYDEYKDDEQFQTMVEDYGVAYGEEFLADVATSKLLNDPLRGGGGNECYQYVTNVKQTKNYNCGSTTTLQTLYGLNSQSALSGSTNANKISKLDADYNVDSQGSMMVYQVVDALNKYNIGNQTYIYEEATNMNLVQFESNIASSLTYGKPVVLHAKTAYLSYYNGKNTGHYLSLDYVNRTTDKVRIVDCNNNTSYYGIHTNIPLSEAYDTIHAESGRYLIY